MRTGRFSFLILIIVFMVFVSSCNKVELYQNLSEEDTNEMLVLLSENGITAHKKKNINQNTVSYSLVVANKDLSKARGLLVKHNLPRRKELGLTGVYKEKGLIPTPDEQKARFLLALKGEIINSLEKIPQIVDADVVLNVPTKDEFADAAAAHRERPTASVVVKTRPMPNGEPPISEAKIQQFVANAVEGLNPRDITVVITYLPSQYRTPKSNDVVNVENTLASSKLNVGGGTPEVFSSKIMGLKLDEVSKDKLKKYILMFFLILIVLSFALIIAVIQASRMRRKIASMQEGPAGQHPALEGQVIDDSPPELNDGENDEELL